MKTVKQKIKAVIFDMDGTIIDTESIWQGVTYALLHENGIKSFTKHDLEMLGKLSGMGLHPASELVKAHFSLSQPLEEIKARKLTLANEQFAKNIEFIRGFEDFHAKLREHEIPSSIATNATPENFDQLIKTMKFERFFGDKLFCIGHVDFVPKPDPRLFLYAAQQLGAKPEECVVFEDSLYGFQAAKAAGMRCIAIKNGHNQHLMEMVDSHIESYHEAEQVLRDLVNKEF